MISKLSAESTIGVGLPSSTVCSSVSFPCIVARVSKSVFHRLLLLLFLPSLHVQPSSELYPSIKLAITPPSIHPFIQLPVGAAWGRVLVGCCRPPPSPSLLSLVPSAGLSFSCSYAAAAAATAASLTPSTKLAATVLPPTHSPPRRMPRRGGFLLTGGKQSDDGVVPIFH